MTVHRYKATILSLLFLTSSLFGMEREKRHSILDMPLNTAFVTHYFHLLPRELITELRNYSLQDCRQIIKEITPYTLEYFHLQLQNRVCAELHDSEKITILTQIFWNSHLIKRKLDFNYQIMSLNTALELKDFQSIAQQPSNLYVLVESIQKLYGIKKNRIAFAMQAPQITTVFRRIIAESHDERKSAEKLLLDRALMNDGAAVKKLLACNVNPNAHTYNGNTPLINACLRSQVNTTPLEIITELLRSGANIDRKNKLGVTALMSAVTANNYEIAKLLLEKGADATLKNNNGHCATDMAKFMNRSPLMLELFKKI